MQRKLRFLISALTIVAVIVGCNPQRKLVERLAEQQMRADISLPAAQQREFRDIRIEQLKKDTLVVQDFEGNNVLIMNAIKDDDGDMVATETLEAAVVTARFRNIAERNGMVDLEFQVIVPPPMLNSEWQLRFYPDMFILGDSTRLEPVVITGSAFRNRQKRGMERFSDFMKTIIRDSTLFLNNDQLEIFLKRNCSELYKLKNDTTFVSEERMKQIADVTDVEAIRHYTEKLLVRQNEKRIGRIDKMYKKYVKNPIETKGLRLDTVIVNANGNFVYNYIETIQTRPKLRKADIVLSGSIIDEEGKVIYEVPRSDSLTFYISSLSAFVDKTERYLTKVIERKAAANATYNLVFDVRRTDLSEATGNNREELMRIRQQLGLLLENSTFDVDSIIATATASPEGSLSLNSQLSTGRGASVAKYIKNYVKRYQDSLEREKGISINLDETFAVEQQTRRDITITSKTLPENWEGLTLLVEKDTVLTDTDKEMYKESLSIKDLDKREVTLNRMPSYRYMKEKIYPELRTVRLDFGLSRKGMLKDTVHTTVIDSVYMAGVRAIEDRDYELAINLLGRYNDYNTAVAYSAINRNYSALSILENIKEKTPQVLYMLAVIYSRQGEPEKAVSNYLEACKQNPSFVYRGNLDPEIAILIKQYGLNRQDDDDNF